jgi:hypothetical protein
MPDSDPPDTRPPSELPASQHYVDDAIATAIADIKQHFDEGIKTVVRELLENRRVNAALVEELAKERASRRNGLRIVKDDLLRLEERVLVKIRRLESGLPADEPAPGHNGS